MLDIIKANLELAKAAVAAITALGLLLWGNQRKHDKHQRDIEGVHDRLTALNEQVLAEREHREKSRAATDQKLDTLVKGVHELTICNAKQKTFLETLHNTKIG